MTRLPLYQIDAFASRRFEGNPAAVVPLEAWLPDETMRAIANENNLSETAFFVPGASGAVETAADFHIRWFTPAAEVDLCGHATLAAGWVLFNELGWQADRVSFASRSGHLSVRNEEGLIELDFPALPLTRVEVTDAMSTALGSRPVEAYTGMYLVCVYENEQQIAQIRPDFQALKLLPGVRAVCVTSPGDHHDFVSRLFAPAVGIDEDPVTGSAHCLTAPYWSKRLGKDVLSARQISERGGDVRCAVTKDRVLLAGQAVPYMTGAITLD